MLRSKLICPIHPSYTSRLFINGHIAVQCRKKTHTTRSSFSHRELIDRSEMSHPHNSKQRKPSLRRTEDEDLEYIYGLSSVVSALRSKKRSTIDSVYIQKAIGPVTTKKKDDSIVNDIMRLAIEAKIKTVETDKQELNALTDNKPHQGVALLTSKIKPLEIRALTEVAENVYTALPKRSEADIIRLNGTGSSKRPFWIALDEVQDPQNLGSILRTAFFFGVDGVLLCTKNSAPLSPTVSKVSSGALELMNVYSTTKIVEFLNESRNNGWEIIGAAGDVEQCITPAQAASTIGRSSPTILVLGNEARGLRKNVRNVCGNFISIKGAMQPTHQNFGGSVDSLNVGVAAGILINSFMMNN